MNNNRNFYSSFTHGSIFYIFHFMITYYDKFEIIIMMTKIRLCRTNIIKRVVYFYLTIMIDSIISNVILIYFIALINKALLNILRL